MKTEVMTLEQEIHPNSQELFMGFMKLGLMGFGGVLPLAHRMIVDDRKWLNIEEFTHLLGVCQLLPVAISSIWQWLLAINFKGLKEPSVLWWV